MTEFAGRTTDAGDLNNDGIDDLVVTRMLADDGADNAGGAVILYGRTDGFDAEIDLPPAPSLEVAQLYSTLANEAVGQYLAGLDDFNGDGIADLLLSAQQTGPSRDTGAAYVIFGAPDDILQTDSATATVTITGVNDLPVAPAVDLGTVDEEAALVVFDPLAGASDPDGDALSWGTGALTDGDGNPVPFTVGADDTVAIDPAEFDHLDAGESVDLTFTYRVFDSLDTFTETSATLTVTGLDETLPGGGTAGDDTLAGTSGDDVIDGGAGNDLVEYADGANGVSFALDGTDVVVSTATEGTDTLRGVERLLLGDGVEVALSLADGRLTVTRTDAGDAHAWSALETVYDASGRIEETTTDDGGDVTTFTWYPGGGWASRLYTDGANDDSYTTFLMERREDGSVARQFWVYDDLEEVERLYLEGGGQVQTRTDVGDQESFDVFTITRDASNTVTQRHWLYDNGDEVTIDYLPDGGEDRLYTDGQERFPWAERTFEIDAGGDTFRIWQREDTGDESDWRDNGDGTFTRRWWDLAEDDASYAERTIVSNAADERLRDEVVADDGDVREDVFNADGTLTRTFTDGAGNDGYETLAVFYADDLATVTRREWLYDGGDGLAIDYRADGSTERVLTDGAGDNPYQTYAYETRPDGSFLWREWVWDDGDVRRLDYGEDGSQTETETDTTDVQDWFQRTRVYDADGNLVSETFVDDLAVV